MNRFWKWTLGILGILIVLAILAIPFALHHRFGFSAARSFDNWHGPTLRDHHGFGFDRVHVQNTQELLMDTCFQARVTFLGLLAERIGFTFIGRES